LAGLRALLLSLLLVAILIVVLIGSLNDWQKEKQFKVLNEKREEHVVVIRDGEEQMIVIHSIVLGDVVLFEPGKIVPCDGIFLLGHNVQCDESGATGKSDAFKKLLYCECIALRERRLAKFDPDSAPDDSKSTGGLRMNTDPVSLDLLGRTDCFVISGSEVIEGIGSYLVITIGPKTFNRHIMMGMSFVRLTLMFPDKAMTCSVMY